MSTIDPEQWERLLASGRTSKSRLRRGGVLVGAGDDTPAIPWAMHWELEAMVRLGYSPLEAITTATGTAARILGADEIGIIREGNLADLVLLEVDPTDDIRGTRRIWQVIRGGHVVDRGRLRSQ